MSVFEPEYVAMWARAFAFTQIVEVPIYRRAVGIAWWRCFAPTAITHPFVWFVFPPLLYQLHLPWIAMVVVAEIFAWLTEAAFLAKTKPTIVWRRAVLVSLIANGASLGLGLLSRRLFGVP